MEMNKFRGQTVMPEILWRICAVFGIERLWANKGQGDPLQRTDGSPNIEYFINLQAEKRMEKGMAVVTAMVKPTQENKEKAVRAIADEMNCLAFQMAEILEIESLNRR